MSLPGNSRDRATEPSELERAQRRAAGLCRDCDRRSKTTLCPRCRRRIEKATERYTGQGRKGPPRKITVDIVDINYALEAMSKAARGWLAVSESDEQNPRRVREMLIEHRAQLDLSVRFALEVLGRNP